MFWKKIEQKKSPQFNTFQINLLDTWIPDTWTNSANTS